LAVALLVGWVLLLLSRKATAQTLVAPASGKPFALPDGLVACAVDGGWTFGADHHFLKPPATESSLGQWVDVAVAASEAGCASTKEHVSLVTTGPWPTIDPTSVIFLIDDARLELKGRHLRGARVAFRSGGNVHGEDVCVNPQPDGTGERCSFSLAPGGLATPSALSAEWLPAGTRGGADHVMFDAEGRRAPTGAQKLDISRVVLATLLRQGSSLDAALGGGTLPLEHPEAVLGADCAPAACSVEGGAVTVSMLPATMSSLPIRLRLAPRVVMRAGDAIDVTPTVRVPVMHCPVSVASGPMVRGVEQQTMVLRMEGRCAAEAAHLRYLAGQAPVSVERVIRDGAAALVLLRVGYADAAELPIAVVRDDATAFTVAQTVARMQPAPSVRVALELSSGRVIDFVPTNVDAVARVVAPSWDGHAEIAPLEGAYTTRTVDGRVMIRGAPLTGGSLSLHVSLTRTFAAPLGTLEIAKMTDASVRAVREANVPVVLTGGTSGALVEVVCDDGSGPRVVAVGDVAHVPFERRDGCRLVFHRERLDPAMGTQKLELDVDVTRIDGGVRSEARVSRTITIEPAGPPRTVWLRGAEGRFDRYAVRIKHVADDRHYDAATDTDAGLPSAQWSVVTGRGVGRLYATSAIPTGMYRVSDKDHSGIMTLNFGVIARLTWLDSLGREGLIALESGVMALGLANDTSATGRSLTQVATVAGLGLAVPIANRGLATETSVNLHAWFEYEPSRALGNQPGSEYGFVFGPSISIGNLGTDL
jgi:hypothetical protein